MRRRLILAICGTVAATLLVAGIGTVILADLNAREATRKDLLRQATAIAQVIEDVAQPAQGGGGRFAPLVARQRLQLLASTLEIEDVRLLLAGPNLELRGEAPEGIRLDDLQPGRLRNGETVSGSVGGTVFAAAPGFSSRTLPNGQVERVVAFAVVVAGEPASVAGPAARWFLLGAAGAMLLGVVVAFRLSRRLTEPVVAARDAARRIASGDLAARVAQPPDDSGDELSELSRSLNVMAEALERSRGLDRQFLMSVSHDLRTPLASIQGYAEALADHAIEPARATEVILAESRRLDRLVTDLLLLARLDARSFTFDLQTLDTGPLVAATAAGFAPRAQERGVVLTVHSPAGTVPAVVDGDRLGQVVANLLENALKFAHRSIEVDLRSEDGWVVLSVADDGPGIDPEDLPHVFERLYVAKHRPAPRESGSGLGLAIVRELVEAMGGHVSARSPVPGNAAGAVTLVALRPG
jgi:signal transduction histidine kinase